MHSFEGATRVTQEIANQIADYSKHSIERSSKTMEKLLGARSPDKAFEVQTKYARAGTAVGAEAPSQGLGMLHGGCGMR